jgi:hypothetical protein
LVAQADGVYAVPAVLQVPTVMESRHRVWPGVQTVGTQRLSTQASDEEHGSGVHAVPDPLQLSCTPLTGLQRSWYGMHTGGLQAFAAPSHPVRQNCRKPQALPEGVQASSASLLHRFSPAVQIEAPDVAHTPLAQARSHVCTTA